MLNRYQTAHATIVRAEHLAAVATHGRHVETVEGEKVECLVRYVPTARSCRVTWRLNGERISIASLKAHFRIVCAPSIHL